MKNQLLFFCTVLFNLGVQAQDIPKVILKDSSELKLSTLHVDVRIMGNLATTTYKMRFYNPKNRILEGELAFPLGQGQSVSEFAMDVNGEMRKAVVVEKELARVAYERTISRKIDPGLLEKTQGNNYKARIYPIPARGYKEIEISHEQNLFIKDDAHFFELPLGFKNRLDTFSVKIQVDDQSLPPSLESGKIRDMEFNEWERSYVLETERKNYTPRESMVVKIPVDEMATKVFVDNGYFHIYKTLKPEQRLKKKPRNITILWDASFSMKTRLINEELNILEEYFKYLKDVDVRLVGFSNSVRSSDDFSVKNGNWNSLKEAILTSTYDGGTSFSALNLKEFRTDEFLLFSDGMDNLGALDINTKKKVYVINSLVSANHKNLDDYAIETGGAYINLRRLSNEDALEVLKNEVFQFLGATYGENIDEVYPNTRVNVRSDFSISGRHTNTSDELELRFGYGNETTLKYCVDLKRGVVNKTTSKTWAKNKLEFLTKSTEENKRSILRLAKKYQLITSYTSMLILDRVEDYARYRIEPPKELRARYKELVKDLEANEASRIEELAERKAELTEDYDFLWKWWNTDFPNNGPKKKPVKTTEGSSSSQTTNQNAQLTGNEFPPGLDPTKRIVTGTVTDSDRNPLPGVNVYVLGSQAHTQTDFDGNFQINVETGNRLEFSYIGMLSNTLLIGDGDRVNITMEEDSSQLDEVVVVGYGTVSVKSVTASVTTVVAEDVGTNEVSNVSRILSGKASGVQITTATGKSGASQSVQIRGLTSFNASNEPMYIVDGVPVSDYPSKNLSPEDIEEIQVLESAAATTLYGSRGTHGLMIITTKKGLEENLEAIQALESEIKDKISLKPWNPETPYLEILAAESNTEDAYDKYLEIRQQYSNVPTFYIDVADFFDKRGENEIAIMVLSNLIEIELDNHELMRALAYKLEYFKKDDLAIHVYEEVLKLRPEEPQSYRDLALAYKNNGNYTKAYQLLSKIVSGDLLEKDEEERFYGIEQLGYVEINNLIQKHEKSISNIDNGKIKIVEMPMDIRVVVDWNHNDTDLDLWVEDPNGERCYYGHSKTDIGGRISEDMTDGYGPEEFMLKKAIKGEYTISVDYFAESAQKISGPTMLKVTIYMDYGKPTESRKVSVVRLDKGDSDKLEVGTIQI